MIIRYTTIHTIPSSLDFFFTKFANEISHNLFYKIYTVVRRLHSQIYINMRSFYRNVLLA